MGGDGRLTLAEAQEAAEELVTDMRPYAGRLEVAGSIRRLKPDVGDIDIVAEPLPADRFSLFGYAHSLDQWFRERLKGGVVEMGEPAKDGKAAPKGPGVYRFRYRGVNVDLYVVTPPANYWVILAIRTGPADYNVYVVKKAGERGVVFRGGHLEREKDGRILNAANEQAVYALCGVPWLSPAERERWRTHIT